MQAAGNSKKVGEAAGNSKSRFPTLLPPAAARLLLLLHARNARSFSEPESNRAVIILPTPPGYTALPNVYIPKSDTKSFTKLFPSFRSRPQCMTTQLLGRNVYFESATSFSFSFACGLLLYETSSLYLYSIGTKAALKKNHH
jgi:hypothetical protein